MLKISKHLANLKYFLFENQIFSDFFLISEYIIIEAYDELCLTLHHSLDNGMVKPISNL